MVSASNQSPLIFLYRELIGSTLVALVALLGYFALPESKEKILPTMIEKAHLFFDAENGGKTTANWIDERQLKFKCSVVNSDVAVPYCGVSVTLISAAEGVDYSKFKRMELKINYRGDNKLIRLKMHNFNPATPKDNYRETLKGLDLSFMKEETRAPVVINTYGWISANTGSNHRIDIGLDLVPPITPGEHEFTLEYADIFGELLPASHWYLGVALSWLMFNLLFITHQLRVQAKRIHNDSRRLSTLAHVSNDLQKESERYKMLSNVDSLTGALNRNGFSAEIIKLTQSGKALHNNTMMVIDLDHFKRINDNFGHDAGDAVLRETSLVIKKSTRATDLFVRWGGEEFLLVCTDTSGHHALLIAEKIRSAVEAMNIVYQEQEIPVTVSIGVGAIRPEENLDDLFQRADQALYNAKQLGRNCVVVSEPD